MSGRLLNLIIFLLSAAIVLNSCLKDDPGPNITAADGIYIKGNSTAFNQLDENGLMKATTNEVNGQSRMGLYETFIAISSESEGFNIIEVVDKTQTIYGPLSKENIVLNGENGQINGTIQKGSLGPDAGLFTTPENGIYHVIIDQQTGTYVISPVSDISLFGHATGEEWSDTDIPLVSGFDESNMMYETTGLDMMEGEFRFRYGHGDKIEILGDSVKVHTSFGGILSGTMPSFALSMVPGGNNYLLDIENEGTYTLSVSSTIGEGFTAQMTETGSYSYPEKLFMIGDGVSALDGADAWNWELNDYEMIPVNSNPHLFWKIVWLNSDGGIRFAPQKGPENDFGKAGDIVDELYSIGDEDVSVPGTAGYNMIMVNLQTDQISVSLPEVYLIGDAVGSWDIQNAEGKFTVDNSFEEINLVKYLNAGTLRMYAWHAGGWFTKWWNAEFNVHNGEIVFRGKGPNLESVNITAAIYTLKLNFRTGEGLVQCKCSE